MKHRDEILRLHKEGKTRPEICKILGCGKSVVCYHLTNGQKEKTRERTKKRRKSHPYINKIASFRNKRKKPKTKQQIHKWKKVLQIKIEHFCRDRKNYNMYQTPTFTVDDVINKFGENPKCYLTGEQLDIYQPRTYSFDHIMPASRGGLPTLDNLGLCTKQANQAKSDLTPEEFYQLCKKVVQNIEGSNGIEPLLLD